MPSSEKADKGPFHHPVLADNDPLDLEEGVLQEICRLLAVCAHRRPRLPVKLKGNRDQT
jgi:hypothetical protein